MVKILVNQTVDILVFCFCSLTEMKVGEVLKEVLKLVPDLPGLAESQV